jgi:putative acetyltransferase
VTPSDLNIRRYDPDDEAAAIELWRRSWQTAYPAIDFAERLDWWRERWRNDTVATAAILVAEREGALVGFVTVNPSSGYLDQLVVAPEAWGAGVAARLMQEAFRLAPCGIDLHVNQDNTRAIRFYQKHGFRIVAESVNPRSGLPVYLMRWMPA